MAADAYACETVELLKRMFYEPNVPPVILTRPTNQHSWDAPGGIFKIHYDTEGPNTVYNVDEDINPPDGIPDYVNRTADYLNLAYSLYIEELSFDPPPPDDEEEPDGLYDIYLTEVPALTTPESHSNYYPGRDAYTSYIQLGHDLRTPHYPDDPLPFLKVCAAHEYFHAVQFAYRAYSSDETPWLFESGAGWAEELVFDSINDVYYKLDYYLPNLHKSLYQSDGSFTYGTWIFSQFLADRFGNPLMRQIWEKFASFDFAVDAVGLTLDQYGADFNDEYSLHVVWNYFTGDNYRPGFYEEGADFGETIYEAMTHSEYPVDWVDDPIPQENLSGAYIVFQNISTNRGNLIIEYMNNTDDKHSIAIVRLNPGSGVQYNIYLVQNFIINTFTVEDFDMYEKVIMMPIWLYEGNPSTGVTSYSYAAHIDSINVGLEPDTPETPISFEIENVYPNPFNGSVNLSFTSPREGFCEFIVYGISGQKIYHARKPVVVGDNLLVWRPSERVASGIHFYEIIQDNNSIRGKFVYLK
jgi:hypothetical protein